MEEQGAGAGTDEPPKLSCPALMQLLWGTGHSQQSHLEQILSNRTMFPAELFKKYIKF